MKTIRNSAVQKLLVVGLFAVCVFPVAASAQAVLQGRFRLQDQVRWNKAVLPAGDYAFTIDSVNMPMRANVHSTDGKTSVNLLAHIAGDPDPGPSSIFITGTGSQQVVRSMNLPQLGVSLIYLPLTKVEKERQLSRVETGVTHVVLAIK